MTSKEAKTHIIDTINGDMVKEYFINEILPEILKKLERLENLERWEWEELENDRLLDRAEKEELERVNKVLNHNLEEKVEIIFELEQENQNLKRIIRKLLNGLNNIVECKPKEIRGFILLFIEEFEDRFKEVLDNAKQ